MHLTLTHEETEDKITSTIVSDGMKNTVFLVSGTIDHEDDSVFDIIDLSRLAGSPSSIRMDGLLFTIESGLKLLLKYRNQPYVLPLEGRSKIDLGWVGGVTGHQIDLVCKGKGAFFLVVDVSKMGV